MLNRNVSAKTGSSRVWMYGGKWCCPVDDIDDVEPIAEQIEAIRREIA